LPDPDRRPGLCVLAYYLALASMLAASFGTPQRLWGMSIWGYFPTAVPFGLFALGALAPLLPGFRVARRTTVSPESPERNADRRFRIFSVATIALLGVLFYLMRARTHFLGDGYQLISKLAQTTYLKEREYGESLVHVWVKSMLGVDGKEGARLSYQLVSIVAGVALLAAATLFSRRLFSEPVPRRLFLLGIASGGYMLLYFGYVENYGLFVLSVMVYTLGGLLIACGRMSRWFIWPFLGVAILFHVLGMTLFPSAVYLFFANAKIGRWLAHAGRPVKRLLAAAALLAVAAVFTFFYVTDYFFRFSIVPFVEDWLTLDGYTMFSLKHLLDYLNLLFVLLPAWPVLAALLCLLPVRRIFRTVPYRYLAVLSLSALGAVFVFDPKLGMPRDWDLFAFAGVPLVTGFFYLLIDRKDRLVGYAGIGALSILLGFVSLLPRAAAQTSPETAITMVRDFMDLDRVKNRYTRFVLGQYYKELGDTTAAMQEAKRWQEEFPERVMITQAWGLRDAASAPKAAALLRQVLKINPHYSDAWSNLAAAYYLMGQYDSGLYFCRIADGLNPNSAPILSNLGTGYYHKGEYDRAEKIFMRASYLDSGFYEIPLNLSHLYLQKGDVKKAYRYLLLAVSKPNAGATAFSELGEYYLAAKDFGNARKAYDEGLRRGLDTAVVRTMEERFPALRKK
jgi:tetratricopeptide (TPR) repeat protein